VEGKRGEGRKEMGGKERGREGGQRRGKGGEGREGRGGKGGEGREGRRGGRGKGEVNPPPPANPRSATGDDDFDVVYVNISSTVPVGASQFLETSSVAIAEVCSFALLTSLPRYFCCSYELAMITSFFLFLVNYYYEDDVSFQLQQEG
jgi:hypothetical protein